MGIRQQVTIFGEREVMAKMKTSLDAIEASYVKQLQEHRKGLLAEIAGVDAKLRALGQGAPAAKPGRPAKAAVVRRGRRRGAKPLRTFIAEVLGSASGPLTVKEIKEGVSKAGYPSTSPSLYSQVHKALKAVPGVKRVSRGKYATKAAAAPKRGRKKRAVKK